MKFCVTTKATEIGPTVATAACNAASLVTDTEPVTFMPDAFDKMYLHEPEYF